MGKLQDLQGRKEHLAKQQIELYQNKPDMDWSAEELKNFQDWQRELTAIGAELDPLVAAEAEMKQRQEAAIKDAAPVYKAPFADGGNAGDRGEEAPAFKTLGEMFTQNATFKAMHKVPGARFGVDIPDVTLKTLMTTTAGLAPANPRGPKIVLSAQRRPVVADLIPQDNTNAAAIKYMEETTFTNNAAFVAEGGTKGEAALVFTERTALVETLAVWIPVTMQQLEDVDGMRAVIDNRLRLMLELKEEDGLLNGNGVSPQLDGFYNKITQTQAKGADATPTAIYKAITKVRVNGMAEPTGIILHPNDWQDIATLQDLNGNYIYGNPFNSDVTERLWGLPVIATAAATEGTGLLGDFQLYSHISRKMGIRIDVSDSHSTYFVENKLAIRAEERLALEIYRILAFCEVTGI
jgi:HK97 family phage major capsid protein